MTSLNSHSCLTVSSPGSYTAPREAAPVSPHRSQTLGSSQHRLPIFEALRQLEPAHLRVTAGRARPAGTEEGYLPFPGFPGSQWEHRALSGTRDKQAANSNWELQRGTAGVGSTSHCGQGEQQGQGTCVEQSSAHPSPAPTPARGGL